MKKRWFVVLLGLALLLACVQTQTAESVLSPAPMAVPIPADTPKPIEVEVIATPETGTVSLEPPTLPPDPTPTPTPSPTPTPPPLHDITIGIDAGRQARANLEQEPIAPDSDETAAKCVLGTRGIMTGVYEYEVNLAVALKLRTLLEADGATVIMTRTGNDVDLSNRERAERFNASEVDLAIVLRCNGADDTSVHGAFMLVPTRERTAFYNDNVRVATTILEQYCKATGLEARKHNGITYRSDQTVFNWCSRPIICIEMGHLSNETEDLLLTNDAFQDKMAFGIYRGVLACFRPDSPAEGGNP